jgi:hypothetical protein
MICFSSKLAFDCSDKNFFSQLSDPKVAVYLLEEEFWLPLWVFSYEDGLFSLSFSATPKVSLR